MPIPARPSNFFLKSLFILNLFTASIVLEAGNSSPAGEPVPAPIELVVSDIPDFSPHTLFDWSLSADAATDRHASTIDAFPFRRALIVYENRLRAALKSRGIPPAAIARFLHIKCPPRSSSDEDNA